MIFDNFLFLRSNFSTAWIFSVIMGCVKSLHLKNQAEIFPKDVSLINEHYSLPISNEDKALLRESWKHLENMKDAMGKTIFTRYLAGLINER